MAININMFNNENKTIELGSLCCIISDKGVGKTTLILNAITPILKHIDHVFTMSYNADDCEKYKNIIPNGEHYIGIQISKIKELIENQQDHSTSKGNVCVILDGNGRCLINHFVNNLFTKLYYNSYELNITFIFTLEEIIKLHFSPQIIDFFFFGHINRLENQQNLEILFNLYVKDVIQDFESFKNIYEKYVFKKTHTWLVFDRLNIFDDDDDSEIINNNNDNNYLKKLSIYNVINNLDTSPIR